jgi:hypothetical protein
LNVWISRKAYEGLQRQAVEHKTLADWLRVRVNQLERERAQLLQRALSIPIEAPELLREEPARPLPSPGDLLRANGVPALGNLDFDDIGDDLAQSLGIDHDSEGRIRYRG